MAKLYVVRWNSQSGVDEYAFDNLAQALVRFGKLIERIESASKTNLMIDWSSIAGGRTLDVSDYIVAFTEGGDQIADAKVWVTATRQHNYST